MTERKNQRKHLTYNTSQKTGERYNLAPSMPIKRTRFFTHFVRFSSENIALRTLENSVKTDEELKEKRHLNKEMCESWKRKQSFPTRYVWHKDKIKSFDKIFFPKKFRILSLDNVHNK